MPHVAPYKRELVARLVQSFDDAQVIGVVNIQGIPSPQFQAIRRKLRGKASLVVTKNNLLKIALHEAASRRSGLEKLEEAIEGQSAVVTANINPFRLFRELETTKTKAPARGGEAAPEDIWVREGETPFKPGPVVGDFQRAGIPAAIERGKVVIKTDKLVVKQGGRIPRDVAQALARLEIYPLTVGLDLRGAYEGGFVFGRDVLAVDDAKVRADVTAASRHALNLAVFVSYPTARTVRLLLSQAHAKALNLAVNAEIPTRESIKILLAKARAHMLALASRIPEETVKKEEVSGG